MFSRPLVLASLIVGSMAAAGGGAYLAVRHAAAPAAITAAPAHESEAPLEAAVQETESVVALAPQEAEPASRAEAPGVAVPAAVEAPRPAAARPRTAAVARPPDAAVRTRPPTARSAPVPASEAEAADSSADNSWVGLDRPWPSRESAAPAEAWEVPVYGEPLPLPEPVIEDVVISADSVIGLQIDTPVNSERARVEDRIEAHVTRDVTVGAQVAVPAGTRALGSVTLVERGGKIKERARLGIRFHTLVLADGTRVPIQTDTIFREGESPSGESAAKIGGAAAGGAIVGAIFGGARGAAIGGAAGAAGGTAATMAGDRNPATLPVGSTLTVRLTAPVTITIEK